MIFSRIEKHPVLPAWDRLNAEDAFRFDQILDALHGGTIGGGLAPGSGSTLLIGTLVALRWKPDVGALLGALPHHPENVGLNEIRSTLARLGYRSAPRGIRGAEVLQIAAPVLLLDGRGELWLFTGRFSEAQLFASDGDEGAWQSRPIRRGERFTVYEFEAAGSDFMASQNATQSGWSMENLLRFAPEFRFVLLTSLLSSCIAVMSAFGVTLIFDNVLPSRNLETLAYVAFGFALLLMVESVLRRMSAAAIARSSARLEYLFGTGLFGKVLRLPTSLISGSPISAQLSRLRQFQSIRELPASPLAQTIYELPIVFMCLAVITVMAWPLALMLVFLIAVLVAVVLALSGPLQRQSRRLAVAQATATRLVQQIVVDRAQIARLGMADRWAERVGHLVRDVVIHRRRQARLLGWLNGVAQASLPIAALSIAGLGAILAIGGTITTGQLVASTILTWRLLAVVRQGCSQLSRYWDMQETLRQIDVLKRMPQIADRGRHVAPEFLRSASLRVRSLTFRHPKAIMPVIANASFEVPRGMMVAVTGPSGAGKTTLLRLLAGLAEPMAGSVCLDEVNISQLAGPQRSRHIAYVAQQPFLFYGTVAQNLRFADPMAPDGKLLEHLEETGLGAWLDRLPDGLETRIDPSRDSGLLGADVRTCFSVARALLSNPSVILLDEPVGGLGSDLEARLMAALERRRGSVTSVIVTHRPSIVRRTDAVIEIQNGQVSMRTREPVRLGRAVS